MTVPLSKSRAAGRLSVAVALAALVGFVPRLMAQSASETPSLLQQLSDETQRVYGKARLEMVRVQLPTPQWLEQINQQKAFMRKWGDRIDPEVREQIIEQQERMAQQMRLRQAGVPATRPVGISLELLPTTQPGLAALPTTRPANGNSKLKGVDIGRDTGNLILVATGLLVDNQGHAAFPLYVDKKDVGDGMLLALTGDGQPTRARFIGSDRLTNLTVLQLLKSSGKPAVLGHSRPDDGVLTLVIAADGGARLVVWSNLHPEPGLAVLPDGSVAGFGFDGHFLGASTAKPIVEQLIATGEVHRAILGVLIQELQKDDPIRQARESLGTRPAIQVMQVDADSSASQGGVLAGDMILAIDGEPVGDAPTFAAVIATRSGHTKLHILRGTEEIDKTVTLRPN